MMLTAADKLELALSLARESLGRPLACDQLRGAAQFAQLHRPPQYATYNPGAIFRHAFAGSPHILHVEPVADAVGDVSQVTAIGLLLAESAKLDQSAVLLVDVFQQPDKIVHEGVPCVALAFDGFGAFPAAFSYGDGMDLTLGEVQALWTSATRGGRIDKAPNGLLLRLTGVRAIPQVDVVPESVLDAVQNLAAACETGPSAPQPVLENALALVDGPSAPELADLKTVLLDVARECREIWEKRVQPRLFQTAEKDVAVPVFPAEKGVAVPVFPPAFPVFEPMFAADLPPIPVRREPIRGLFRRILAYAASADAPGAAVSILFDYDAGRRAIVFVATVTGIETVPGHAAYMASMRRNIVDLHGGAFEVSADGSELTLTISLPDPVGAALEQEMPGFDSFSGQSRRVLRLLYSGGPTPPPELLLQGVLEEELARWILPQLESPAAVNVAHDVAQDPKTKPVASADRLKKAIEQIQKSKPKRELTNPSFAAEIVWAYRTDPRRRAAIGAGNLSQSELEQLARLLVSPPTAQTLALALRLLAKKNI